VLRQPAVNISEGRNAAIAAATGEVIAVTDAGVRLERGWLEALVAPFENDRLDRFVGVVSGWFVADPQTLFETAMGATVLPHVGEVKPERFLPSSRSVAFRKVAWEAAGGYPEWLDYCEDLILDFRLRDLYGPFPFVPDARVHFQPRSNLQAFFKQYYRYARGDGKADLWRKRHAIRYLTYLVGGPLLMALALLHSPWWWLAPLVGAAAYTATPYRRLWRMLARYGPLSRAAALLLVPVIRVVGDVAKMLGYPVGLVWRWRNHHRPEIHWR
jgi:cellulose synthase/poly-beta-1,6-N-acetylglucosamine synthase-like glycosyltransferase